MSVSMNQEDLRAILMGKTVEELEELLALNFTEDSTAPVHTAYITTILEVIDEKEGNKEQKAKETAAAWERFQEFRKSLIEEDLNDILTDTPDIPSHDYFSKSIDAKKPRKHSHVIRYCAVIAAVIVLLCTTASAFGWNIFQALAKWTEETFRFFVSEQQDPSHADVDPFENIRLEVSEFTDLPVIPNWWPDGTELLEELEISSNSRKTKIRGAYNTKAGEFTIRITIYSGVPDELTGTYQKNDNNFQNYSTGGIEHYIAENNAQNSAMWVNDNIECYIQGKVSIDDLKEMLDSIYKE